jgi:deazaflavin-dependent oxidoreductase (nitroreductase family)
MPADFHHPPGWFTRNVFNPIVAGLTRIGLPLAGSRVLEVKGRKSGKPYRTPVNPLTIDGDRYLVAPRGNTQWARNLRVVRTGRLLGRGRAEEFSATEVADAEKPEILREYLRRWKWEVAVFFDGVDADSPPEELARIAPAHPVFRIFPPGEPASP